jgi:hypothetical protein
MEGFKYNIVSHLFHYYLDDIIKNGDNKPTIFAIYTYTYFQLIYNINVLFNAKLKPYDERVMIPKNYYSLKNICLTQAHPNKSIFLKALIFYGHQAFMTAIYPNYTHINLRLCDVFLEDPNININYINLIQEMAKLHIDGKRPLIDSIKKSHSVPQWGFPSDITGKPDFKPKNPCLFEPLVIPNGTFINDDGYPIIDINYSNTFEVCDYTDKCLENYSGLIVNINSEQFSYINNMVVTNWENGLQLDINKIIEISEKLDIKQKTIADFLTFHGNDTLPISGFWIIISMHMSQRYNQSFENDILMYFCLSLGIYDGIISSHNLKSKYNIPRPIQLIRHFLKDIKLKSWLPNINIGSKWIPFQPLTKVSPASPDVVCENTVISHISAYIIEWWFKTSKLYDPLLTVLLPNPHILSKSLPIENKVIRIGEFIFNKGPISIEKNVIVSDNIILHYNTIHNLKDDCNNACLFAGISTNQSIEIGKKIGDTIGGICKSYFENTLGIRSHY